MDQELLQNGIVGNMKFVVSPVAYVLVEPLVWLFDLMTNRRPVSRRHMEHPMEFFIDGSCRALLYIFEDRFKAVLAHVGGGRA
jgi:hypothetical protein